MLLLTKENHYQEVFLPFAADHSFPPDTLFFVVEPDFCVQQEDEGARIAWNETVKQEGLGAKTYEQLIGKLGDEKGNKIARACEDFRDRCEAALNPDQTCWPEYEDEEGKPYYGSFDVTKPPEAELVDIMQTEKGTSSREPHKKKGRPERPKVYKPEDCSPELCDMITIASECHRVGCGGLMWNSWNATQWSSWKKKMQGVAIGCPLVRSTRLWDHRESGQVLAGQE